MSRKIVIIKPNEAFELIWIGWFLSWMTASIWSGRTEKRAATRETSIYRAAIFIGAVLMMPWTAQIIGDKRIWELSTAIACVGRLWSSAITRKERHRVIDTGPYAFVRHPIYTGIITALVATAAIEATLAALVGATLVCSGLWLKARAEERFLMVELGPDDYESYCRRVPMLIPVLWHRK